MDKEILNKLSEQLNIYKQIEHKIKTVSKSEITISNSPFNNTLKVNMRVTVPTNYNKQILIEALDRVATQYHEAYEKQCENNMNNVKKQISKIINKEVKNE